MASKVDNLAEKYLGAIKRTIETNKKIKEDFGDLTENINPVDGSKLEGGKGKGGWSKNVLFCRRTNHALKDGTVESIGWGSSITGSRFDLIILDDPVEESDCRTAKNRDKQKENLHKLEELLEPDGQMLVIGTRKHYGDLYAYLIDNPRWTYAIDKGIIKYPDQFDYIYRADELTGKRVADDVYIPTGETYKVLWPEKWSIQALLLKKIGSLPLFFQREIQNEINSDETSDFPKDVIETNRDIVQLGQRIRFYDHRPDWAKWLVAGVDLAGVFNRKEADEKDTDYFCIPVLAIDDKFNKHLIFAYRSRGLGPEEQLNKIVEIDFDYRPDMIVLETNQYQKAMQSMALNKKLPIVPHVTGGEKHSLDIGIPALAIELRNQYFIFYTGQGDAAKYYDILFAELHGYGIELHDDTVLSLWLANLAANAIIRRERAKLLNKAKREGKLTEIMLKEKMHNIQKEVKTNIKPVVKNKEIPQEIIDLTKQLIEDRMKEMELKDAKQVNKA